MCVKPPDNGDLFVNSASNFVIPPATCCATATVAPPLAALGLADLRRAVPAIGLHRHRVATVAHHPVCAAGRLFLFAGQCALRAVAAETPALRPDGAGLAPPARRAATRQAGRLGHHDAELRARLVVHAVKHWLDSRRLLRTGGALDVAPAHVGQALTDWPLSGCSEN